MPPNEIKEFEFSNGVQNCEFRDGSFPAGFVMPIWQSLVSAKKKCFSFEKYSGAKNKLNTPIS